MASASFTDADSSGIHTATIDWGDGAGEDGSVTESGGSGTVAGSHIYADDGTYTLTVCVSDDHAAIGCDTLNVTVNNVGPSVDAGQDQTANQGDTVNLPPGTFTDPGDLLWVSLEDVPNGMGVDPATGQIQWIPTASQVGDNQVTLRAEDLGGLFQLQTFTIVVANVNDPLSIVSTAVNTATVGQAYSYQVAAADPDLVSGDVLTFALDLSPGGMTVDSQTGLIQWTRQINQVGNNAVIVRVTDAAGLSDTQSFTINAVITNRAPVADAGLDQNVDVGATVALNGGGSSDADNDILSFGWTLTVRPAGSAAVLSAANTIQPTFVADHQVRGSVFEGLPDCRRGPIWNQCLFGVLQSAEASPGFGLPDPSRGVRKWPGRKEGSSTRSRAAIGLGEAQRRGGKLS